MQNNSSDSLAGLYAKLAAIMGEMGNIPKDGTNAHFNYKFVTADAIADRVRTLLSQRSIAFFAAIVGKNLVEVRKGSEKTDPKTGEIVRMVAINMRWVVDFEFTFADGESGATITRSWTAEADSGDDKGINKCATAAEKYFLLKTFVVTSADEPDADGDRPRQQKANPAKARPTPPPPSGSPASTAPTNGSDDFDAVFPPPPPDAADTPPNQYRVTQVKVVPQGNSHLYLLKAGNTNITLYGGDLFRKIGQDPEYWKSNPNKWFAVKPTLTVVADFDGEKWHVAEIMEATS